MTPHRAARAVLRAALVLATAGGGCVLIVDPFSYQFAGGPGGGASCGGSAPATLAPTHGFAQTQGSVEGGGLALDRQGNIVAAGPIDALASTGPVAFAGALGVQVAAGAMGMFLASFHPDGTAAFVRGFFTDGGAGSLRIGSVVAVDGVGENPAGIVVGGQFANSLTIGQKLLSGGGDHDAFVAKFDDLGNPLWAQSIGDSGDQSYARVVADKAGDLLIAIRGGGSFALGPACPDDGQSDAGMWLAKLRGGDGTCVWVRKLAIGPSSNAFGLAYDPAHDVGVITGDTSGSDFFGAQGGQTEAFVDTFADADGSWAWPEAVRFGPTAMEAIPTSRWGEQVRVSPCGDIFVSGNFEKDISLGAQLNFTNDHDDAGGGTQLFLAKLSAESGTVAWAKTFPSDGVQVVHGLVVGPGGEIAITGDITDNPGSSGIDFGGGLLGAGAGAQGQASNAFVAMFIDGAGAPSYRFAIRLGDGGSNVKPAHGLDLAMRDTGGLAVTGSFDNTIRFSQQAGEVANVLSYGAFFARYEP
jgi:hypothetical protein